MGEIVGLQKKKWKNVAQDVYIIKAIRIKAIKEKSHDR
jgi:hypothetical protein